MTQEEIVSKVKEAFVAVLEHDNFELTDETTANDVDGWESVTHMMIITEVEKTFGIKFKLMDLMNMNNVGDLMKTIKSELDI